MYPFSTQNSKDFQNLLSVYLDAVFFPCLREQDFRSDPYLGPGLRTISLLAPLIRTGPIIRACYNFWF